VRTSARELTGADGATFILCEHGPCGDVCFYVDEEAIGPLWKGRRFKASSCISGWAMQNRRAVAIEDVTADTRIPTTVYAHTFVKSLVMVPIRAAAPIGAIGCYWAVRRIPSAEEMGLLQALADSTALAMESVQLQADLDARVAQRTAELTEACDQLALRNVALLALAQRKQELCALVAHDIRLPASALMLRAEQRMLSVDSDADWQEWMSIYANSEAVARLAANMLDIECSQNCALRLMREDVPVQPLVDDVRWLMQPLAEAREQRIASRRPCEGSVYADCEVLRRVLQNLVENAVSYNAPHGTVCIDVRDDREGVVLSVSDEGPGVPAEQRRRIFDKYVRLECLGAPRTGRGLGLTFCRLAVEAHGGCIWVEDAQPRGSRFCLRLPPRYGGAMASAPR
jgi:K+-sensing histidine kinase KdpD